MQAQIIWPDLYIVPYRSMVRIIQRIVCPVLLLMVGIGSFIYGTGFHREKIITDQEIEVAIPPAPKEFSSFGPGGFAGPGGEMMPPNFALPPEVNAKPKMIKEIIVTETNELEGTVIKEVTVGGLARLDSGDLKRTYLFGEKPLSLCPT